MSRFLSKDFLAGVMFIAFGLTALYLGRHLAPGTTVRMGPGWVPHMLSYIMLGLGGIISVIALFVPGEQAEAPHWKPITMVTIGIVCFALLLESTGLIPALVALVLIASLGGDEFKILEVIGNIVVLSILCVIVFKIGLSMNISVINGVW
ncbi:MAG: tripartite tricarboxylate transporter TctB family protein [Reyranellales bacterium]